MTGTSVLSFKQIGWEDRSLLTKRLEDNSTGWFNYSFVVQYLYRQVADFQISVGDEFLWLKERERQEERYLFPIGCPPFDKALDQWREHVLSAKGCGCMLYDESHATYVDEWIRKQPQQEFYRCEERNDFEYLYEAESLALLSGHLLKAKRNFVHTFKRTYHWNAELITRENLPEVRSFDRQWNADMLSGASSQLKLENEALQEAFDKYEALSLQGLLLRVDGQVVAFAVGCPLNEQVYGVLFEKADRRYRGAYAMINCEFASRVASRYPYINRAEDGGDQGLRQAKLSYMPARMLKVFSLRIGRQP